MKIKVHCFNRTARKLRITANSLSKLLRRPFTDHPIVAQLPQKRSLLTQMHGPTIYTLKENSLPQC